VVFKKKDKDELLEVVFRVYISRKMFREMKKRKAVNWSRVGRLAFQRELDYPIHQAREREVWRKVKLFRKTSKRIKSL
jgi:hypothetical protein